LDRRPILFTSDWHIGHENVLKFDNRPFKDLDHMAEVLVNNYNASMHNKKGVGYFLGDMGWANSQSLSNVLKRLQGTKVLVLGNHDKAHESMYKTGFDVVLNGATLWIAGQRVTMTHCPLPGIPREDTSNMGRYANENWHGEKKNGRFSTIDMGQFHLHGHIHSPNGGKSQRVLGRQMDVGVPANDYRPVSLSQVESWIALTLQDELKRATT
jgi:calcineurin-like phosphoesterase family protein